MNDYHNRRVHPVSWFGNPLTIEPREDDDLVDFEAHARVRDFAWSLTITGNDFTVIIAPVAQVERIQSWDPRFAPGYLQTLPANGQIAMVLKHPQDVLRLVPAGTLIRVHIAAVLEKKAATILRDFERAGWLVCGVAWNRKVQFGRREGRDAYLGFRVTCADPQIGDARK